MRDGGTTNACTRQANCLADADGAGSTGRVDESYDKIAANAVDLVVSQLNGNETGVPEIPRMLLLPGGWIEPGSAASTVTTGANRAVAPSLMATSTSPDAASVRRPAGPTIDDSAATARSAPTKQRTASGRDMACMKKFKEGYTR